ncbi:hypothetical protein CDL15_Pgr014572 [Punica granatum]|uniref:Alpha/beta hydrolase fold-3 domain-containing protein n=1 Tax=Punica granatum TaxID=22663 RepID=A0A218WEH3_PUNGR|nr:hypothetical protein CDL15_Pgr014572 [Punica granatum]
MASKEVEVEVFPYIRVYKDGTYDRLAGTEVAPPGLDPETDVLSKDIVILPETSVSARLYRPASVPSGQKLPLVVYFHGGAFIISAIADPKYHASLNAMAAEAKALIISVDYRRVPEHPLPAAYDDSWAAIQWVAAQASGDVPHVAEAEPWLKEYADFDRVFLAGDSGGANMSHHLAIRLGELNSGKRLVIQGIGMIHPYFWGEKPIGGEVSDGMRKALVDSWWRFVCPSNKGCDHPLINPFVDGSPGLDRLACERVLVIVSGKDILKDRGRLYYENLVKSGWPGKAEFVEIEDEDHVFHIFDPNCEKAKNMFRRLAMFINYRSETESA